MKTWLAVERLENWLSDKQSGFNMFGIPEHVSKAASKAEAGDQIIVYVSSNISAFADVRTITHDGIKKLGFVSRYDDVYPYCLQTESLLTLKREAWIPIKGMVNNLELTKSSKDWRQIMRHALRVLGTKDAQTIMSRMEAAKHG
ncbi:MAG: hypothetical protein OXE97_09625 [Gammaproteobacteria bacterium]|nr:hypothetical protein [Gammaproteobacteria bacterium]